jgi:Flp pilus assembly protein TadB
VQIEDQGNKRDIGFGGLVARILAAMASVALLVVGFMFSLVIFAVALAVGLVVFGWMWWKFRRAMRLAQQDPRFQQFTEQMRRGAPPPGRGDVIEGEVIRKD